MIPTPSFADFFRSQSFLFAACLPLALAFLAGCGGDDSAVAAVAEAGSPVPDASMGDSAASDASTRDTANDAPSDAASRSDAATDGAAADAAGDAADAGCDGGHCSCVVACSDRMMQKSDGTLYWIDASNANTPTEIKTAAGTPFVATAFSSAGSSTFACAVDPAGTAWCWGSNNAHGELGTGVVQAGSVMEVPARVVTAPGGPALGNVKQIVADPTAPLACAIDASNALWCWGQGGYGQLGTGGAGDSGVAAKVLTASGGPQLTGVTAVALGQFHACALKTDGSVWCWGWNNYGQLGIGSASQAAFPTQVALASRAVGITATSTGFGSSTCATLVDSSVWCWGTGANYGLGSQASTPVVVQPASDAGAPWLSPPIFVGAGLCYVRPSDRSVWCWNGSTTPVAYTEQNITITGVIAICDHEATRNPTYIGSDDDLHFDNGARAPLLSCP